MTSKISVKRWGKGMDPMEIVTRAAWCSYDNDQREYTKEQGERLCAYLFKHKHWTPFAQFGWAKTVSGKLNTRLRNEVCEGKASGFQLVNRKQNLWFGSAWAWHEFFSPQRINSPKDIFEADTDERLEVDEERINLAFDMPIFVARQIMRSNIGIVWNEMSRRYVSSEPELWWPENNSLTWREAPKKGQSKQGSGGKCDAMYIDEPNEITGENYVMDRCVKEWAGSDTLELYSVLTDPKEQNLAPEQARMILPQNTMTRVCGYASRKRWKQLAELRSQPDAQAETRLVAEQILDAVA